MNRPESTTGATSAIPARVALLIATVLAGLSAGFFYTFEASVTLGLAEVSDPVYVETFQAINDTIRNPAFGLAFFGTIPAIGLALVLNWNRVPATGRVLLVAAAVLYLGGLAVTATGNIPLNRDLGEVVLPSVEAASLAREVFEDDWNRLNLIRTVMTGLAFVFLAAVDQNRGS